MAIVAPGDPPSLEDLLPQPWRTQAAGLRRYVRKSRDIRVAELLSRAFDAASRGDILTAFGHVSAAGELATPGAALALVMPPAPRAVAASPGPSTAAGEPRRAATVIRKPLTGKARVPAAAGPVLIATDGSSSADGRHCAWAFIATSGHWGCQAGDYARDNVNGRSGALIAELRAVNLALRNVPGPLTILADSKIALRYLRTWQAGDIARMPAGYDLRPRHSAAAPALVGLAGLVAARAGELTVDHVKGHAGHTLNEGADLLATIARRWVAARHTMTQRAMRAEAADIAATFLAQWHREHA